jgi:hypothetical protein
MWLEQDRAHVAIGGTVADSQLHPNPRKVTDREDGLRMHASLAMNVEMN